jgi:outer membrane protein assembly factor BamA
VIATAALAIALAVGPYAQQARTETITEIIVHGNHVTSNEDVLKITGVSVGAPFTSTTIADVTARLKASKKFDDVSVLKRLASIEDDSKVLLVIVVNEGPVRVDVPDDPSKPIDVVRRRGFRNLMFMPIFSAEDGYGVTVGVRVAYIGATQSRRRVSFPLAVGGTDRVGAELEQSFSRGPLTRVELGSALTWEENPAYQVGDNRSRLWAKAERAAGPVRMNVNTGAQWVTFGGVDDSFHSVGGAVVFDTRIDPVMPRNAVFASASIDRLFFDNGFTAPTNRTRLEARGYLGVFRQNVLVARVVREGSSGPLPPYLRSLLGGWSSLRGFEAGSFTGDNMVAGSLELRVPLNSPVSFGKIGVSAFVDTGAAYDYGLHLRDQTRHTGVGGAGWITIGPVKLGLSVAHGLGSGTRVNFGGGLSF